MRLSCRIAGRLAAAAAVLGATATQVAAQDGFLFEHPRVTLSVRGGHNVAGTNADIYDFFTSELTLDKGDFSGFAFGADVGVRVLTHADVVFSVGHTSSSARSEFRDWVDQDDLPIKQTTTLQRMPVTATLKLYPLARGRSVGTNAWIPQRLTPFVGAGGGGLHYELTQEGDFVDEASLEIFSEHFMSSGWTGSVHALAGADYWFSPRIGVTAEGRYTWASAALDPAEFDYGDIDLRGFQATAGISVRF